LDARGDCAAGHPHYGARNGYQGGEAGGRRPVGPQAVEPSSASHRGAPGTRTLTGNLSSQDLAIGLKVALDSLPLKTAALASAIDVADFNTSTATLRRTTGGERLAAIAEEAYGPAKGQNNSHLYVQALYIAPSARGIAACSRPLEIATRERVSRAPSARGIAACSR
jgi:hypothetical protein